MTAPAAQWQLDRLSTSAREAAEIASLGAGVSLSSWLTKLISETCSAEGVAPPAEPPKILEFTREIRDRIPSTPRLQPASMPMPANTSLPPLQPPMQPSAPQIQPSVMQPSAPPPVAPVEQTAAFHQPIQPPHQPTIAPQPSAAPIQPTVFRPAPAATPAPVAPAAPMPAPTPLVAPISAYRPQPMPTAPIQQAPVQQPMPLPPQAVPHAPVAPLPPAPVAPTSFAAPSAFAQPAPLGPPTIAAPHPVPAGATMLPVAAMVAANLGTRRGDDMPETLLADIATRGVRQPLIVRRSASNPEQYEIICGHRRWRAAQRVGLAQIPAIVVSQDDATAILASLAENLQQGNLSVVEEAQAYLRLLTQCAIDVSAVTAAIGRDRKHIVQSMRLLGLPPLVRHLIGSGMLSREHAFVLLDAPHPEALADAILAEHLSVDAARQRIAAGAEGKP